MSLFEKYEEKQPRLIDYDRSLIIGFIKKISLISK